MDIISHLYIIFLLFASFDPTVKSVDVVVKEKVFIGQYYTTGYYSPLKFQDAYYSWSYEKDKRMNCGEGSCFHTADGYELSAKDELAVVACPRDIDMGTHLFIEWLWEVVCHDRGGSIAKKRLDVWNGIGDTGLNNIKKWAFRDGIYKVYQYK